CWRRVGRYDLMATLAKRGTTSPAESPTGGAWQFQSNLFDGAVGSTPATYSTWSSSISAGVGYIELGGFGFGPGGTGLDAGDTLTSVTATIRHLESSTLRFSQILVQPWLSGSAIGSFYTAVISATARTDTASVGAVTLAQLRDPNF